MKEFPFPLMYRGNQEWCSGGVVYREWRVAVVVTGQGTARRLDNPVRSPREDAFSHQWCGYGLTVENLNGLTSR